MEKKPHWILLLSTFVLSCISIACIITTFATTSWISSDLKLLADIEFPEKTVGTVNYGLFKGTANFSLTGIQQLSIVCNYGENKCAFSCQTDSDLQIEELNRLIKGTSLTGLDCPISKSVSVGSNYNNATGKLETTGRIVVDKSFINAGLYLGVVIFLSLVLIFALVSAIFSMINFLFNPVGKIFGEFGLYIWNGVSLLSVVAVMSLYGMLYFVSMYDNVGIRETLRMDSVYKTRGEASLSSTFWLVAIVLFLHEINMVVLWYRARLIKKETLTDEES